jgi:hypothetical protein
VFRQNQHFSCLENTEPWFPPPALWNSMSSCLASWSHTRYICTLHPLRMGSRDCFVNSAQGNRKDCVPIAQHGNRLVEQWGHGVFLSTAEEVTVVGNLSLEWFQHVRDRETCPTLQPEHCQCSIHNTQWVAWVGACCK